MKCPLLQRYLIEGDNKALEVFDDCLKEECAYWRATVERCAILDIDVQLSSIVAELHALVEKIPHEYQFIR